MIVLSAAVFISAIFPLRLASLVLHDDSDIGVQSQFLSVVHAPVQTQTLGQVQEQGLPPLPTRLTESETCRIAQTNFSQASGLFVIVTGMEHSGTTLVSELLMSAPRLFGAFESGFLLEDSPKDFHKRQTFFKWSIQTVTSSLHWGLTRKQRDQYVTRSACLAEMYRRVHEASPLFKLPKNADSWIIDKTPSYIYNLTRILQLTPGVPIVVTVKDQDAQLQSLIKRGVRRKGAMSRIAGASRALQDAQAVYPERIFTVNMTDLYLNPNTVMERLFQHLSIGPWDPSFLTMQALNAKGAALGRCKVPPFQISGSKGSSMPASKVVEGSNCQDNNGYAAGKRNKLKQLAAKQR